MHSSPRRTGPHTRFLILVIASWALAVPGGAQARIWKCIDADGFVSYVDTPCPQGASLSDTFDETRWQRPAPIPPEARAPSDGSGGHDEDHPLPYDPEFGDDDAGDYPDDPD